MHPGNWVAIKHAVVYCAEAAHTFSAGLKSRHGRCKDGNRNSTKRTICKMSLQD